MIPPHPLTNFEIQKYYQNKPKFNEVYSRDNLPNKIKYGAYVFLNKFIGNKSNISCGYFCITFIGFMLKSKILADLTNFFSPNNFRKNDDII